MSESMGKKDFLEPLMTYQDLSRMLGIAPRTVLNLTRERPERMPVCVYLPGVRGPRWRPETVRNWVAGRENEQRAVVQQKVEMHDSGKTPCDDASVEGGNHLRCP